MTTAPLDDVDMRTGRAARPGIVTGDVTARGCETARERVAVVAGVTVTGEITTLPLLIAAGATVAGKPVCRGTLSAPVAVRPADGVTDGATVAGVVTALDVDVVPTLASGGFAAKVGDGVAPDVTVGVRKPVF